MSQAPRRGARPTGRELAHEIAAVTADLPLLLTAPLYRPWHDATPEQVWPWLVQVGCLKAGLYSNDLLDNFAHPSTRRVIPELQHLEVGQWVSMWKKPGLALGAVILMEFGDFAMMRRMLHGIKDRAEAAA